jgi:hypothetical protein
MTCITRAVVSAGQFASSLIVVETTPHEKRGGPACNGLLLIATNLLDLPAWIIALIYRYR